MQQKVQFIVTVIHEPQLLIFDEPFSGFDPVNATLLKKEGDFVKAGEAIAILGASGELTDGTEGPELHFELWHNGTPLNPTEYINFEKGE